MPRQLRIQYAGALCRVMSRENRRQRAPVKVPRAPRLRREATLTIQAIAARVPLGTSHTVNARLHQAMKEGFVASDSAPAKPGN